MIQDKEAEAKEQYEKLLLNIRQTKIDFIHLANFFFRKQLYDYPIRACERGNQLTDNDLIFTYLLAGIYGKMGDTSKMIRYYLNSVNPSDYLRRHNIQQSLLRIMHSK